jgi:hypothetical protein
MRGFTQTCQIGIALPLAVMSRIRRQIGGDARWVKPGQRSLSVTFRVAVQVRL